MKKIILTFLIVISTISHAQLVEIIPDSISVNLDMVETGGVHTVMMDNIAYSNHSKLRKADARALELKTQYPNSEVYVTSPNATPTSSFKVFIDESKLNPQVDLSEILAKIDTLEIANELKGLAWNDLVTNVIPELERKIAFSDSLNSMKINILQKRIDTLKTFIRDSITFIVENPDLSFVKSIDTIMPGWTDNGNKSYTYDAIVSNKYLVFNTSTIEQGSSYELTFNVSVNGVNRAQFDLWAYPVDEITEGNTCGYVDPRISTYSIGSDTGAFSIIIDNTCLDRNKIGIRAQNFGDGFTISDIEITKL